MTKAERKRLKKNRMCAGKDGCGAKQLNHKLFFHQLPCAFFFTCWSEAFGVAYVPRPQTKSACTPLLPCARLRWQGLRGGCIRARASRGRWVLFFERMVFVQTLLQVLQVDVAVALDAPQVRVASEVLCFPDWFFFRPVGNH
jgi:hypothetical protein